MAGKIAVGLAESKCSFTAGLMTRDICRLTVQRLESALTSTLLLSTTEMPS